MRVVRVVVRKKRLDAHLLLARVLLRGAKPERIVRSSEGFMLYFFHAPPIPGAHAAIECEHDGTASGVIVRGPGDENVETFAVATTAAGIDAALAKVAEFVGGGR